MQEGIQRMQATIAANRDLFLEFVRIYLGVGLFIKGVRFLSATEELVEAMHSGLGGVVDWPTAALAHYVALAHLGGGVLLAIGLFTRLAALVQVPILLGAVFFVHLPGGLFTQAQTLEFAALVLFLLVLYTVFGGGRLSLDHRFFAEDERMPEGTASAHGH